MIRSSTKFFSHHLAARRLHNAQASMRRASSKQSSAVSAAVVGSGSSSDNNFYIGAATISALGLGFAINKNSDENTSSSSSSSYAAQCEVPKPPPPSWQDVKSEDSEEKPRFETIPHSQLKLQMENNDDGNKSQRAFASALENNLFNTYNDGADDWEETDDEDEDTTNSNNDANDYAAPSTNAVMERFVSFSNPASASPVTLQGPRMSIRHTNRKVQRKKEEKQQQKGEENVILLATSDGSEPTKSISDSSSDTNNKETNKDIILKRVGSVRNGLGANQVYTKRMYFYQSSQIKEYMRQKFRLFALPSSEQLGKEMAYLLGSDLNSINVGAFTDGETSVQIGEAVRGKEVFVVCTTTSTTAIMELLLTISALRRGSAKRICAVIPYYGYSRQDRRTGMKREPIAAADITKLLEEMGIDSIICVDLHNPLVKGFFSPTIPVDHLMPGPVAAAYFYEELFGADGGGDKEKKEPKEAPKITVVAAHENQVFRANGFRNALQKLSGNDDIRVALISNTKALNVHSSNTNTSHSHDNDSPDSTLSTLVGDVAGRKCIIVDDIINTGGTMRSAIDLVGKHGASEVYAWATHGVLHLPENDTPQKIQELDCLKYLLISNSVAIERELPKKIRKLSIAPLLAESVARSLHSESIRDMLNVKRAK